MCFIVFIRNNVDNYAKFTIALYGPIEYIVCIAHLKINISPLLSLYRYGIFYTYAREECIQKNDTSGIF